MPLRALRVSLDTNQSLPEELPASVEQQYLGGRGAATWMLANRLPPAVGALAAANLLIFSAGPLSGMGLPATGGFVASTRSPLTGLIAHSWAQGRWGGALRRAGYDLLGARAIFPPPAASMRRPGYLAELAWQRFQSGDLDDVATLEPIYLGQPVRAKPSES